MFKLIQQSRLFLPSSLFRPQPVFGFSEYFRDLDRKSMKKISHEYYTDP